jgi:hypothetical protein
MAVMLRRRMTMMGGNVSSRSVTASILSVTPNRKRPVNPEDAHVVGNVLVLEHVRASALDVLVGDLRDGGRLCDAADEEQRSEDHADLHGHGEIGEDGQRESDQPDRDVRPAQFQQLGDLAPLPHVVGNNEQNRREYRERNVRGQGLRRSAE